MTQTVSNIEKVITQFRQMLPTKTATALAIDQDESWDRIALKAVEDGYIEIADEFAQFVEVCVRHG